MRGRLRVVLAVGLPLLTVVAFFVLLAFSLGRLALTQKNMRLDAPHNNLLWVISQAQTSSLRLDNAVDRLVLGTGSWDRLQRSRQVFLSRLALMREGPQERELQALGYAESLREFSAHLPRLEGLLDQLEPGAADVAGEVATVLEPLHSVLAQAATQAMVGEWESMGTTMEASRAQLRQAVLSLVGLLLAGAALSFYLLRAMRRTREHARSLRRARAFSERIIRSSAEGVLAIDQQQRWTICNKAAEQLFGRRARDVVGRPLGALAPLFEVAAVAGAIKRALAGRSSVLTDQPFFRTAGAEPRYLELRCAPIRSDARVVGAIVIAFDTTEQRAVQREIAMHRDHLEELVRARTQELDAALEREREAAELYRNFGAMISHQFRTPLAIVDSTLQRMMRRGDRLSAAELRERSQRARDAIDRLTRLIKSTLDAARLDAGQIVVQARRCALERLAATACELQREDSPEREFLLQVTDAAPLCVLCDPVQTEHVLVNLLSNAVRYGRPGTPITLRLYRRQQQVCCDVCNAGDLAGGADTDLLFERYYRGADAGDHAGIGIGLYMARSLARLQGGDLVVGPSEAGTTCFTFSLPAAAQQPRVPHEPQVAST